MLKYAPYFIAAAIFFFFGMLLLLASFARQVVGQSL